MSFAALEAYLLSLSERNAGAIDYLRDGASSSSISKYEFDIGCEFPAALKQLWQCFDGISAVESGRFFTFYPDFMLPLSVEESQSGYRMFEELRTSGEYGFDIHFPKGFVQIAQVDAGGFWINCLPKSRTFGAVYYRLLTSDPMERFADDLSQFFSFLEKAVQEGAILIASEDDDYCYKGDVMADAEALNQIARRLLPNCPAHNWEQDCSAAMQEEWLRVD